MIAKLRNKFIAGLLVVIPIATTTWVLMLLFSMLDGSSQPILKLYLGREVPGVGWVLTVLIVVVLGHFSELFIGQAVVVRFDRLVARVPLVSSVYRTVQQVIKGFSSGDSTNFKRAVMVVDEAGLASSLGFVTREFALVSGDTTREMTAVYVPTNHLYLGEILILPRDRVLDVGMSLEEGISAVLSCGGSLAEQLGVVTEVLPDEG
ncbi:MAG: DUF502 domain-containing protein [Candidatus Binatia bacterium]